MLQEQNVDYLYFYNFRQKFSQFDEQRIYEGHFGHLDKNLRAYRFHRIETGIVSSSKQKEDK